MVAVTQVWAYEYITPIAKCVNRLGNGRIYPATMAWGSFSKKVNYNKLKGTLRKLRRKDVSNAFNTYGILPTFYFHIYQRAPSLMPNISP